MKTALPAAAKAIKGGWDNIQSLHIKTSTSTSLPIWTCDLGAEEGGRWSGLVEVAESESEDESEAKASEGEEEPEPVVEKKAAKGKKRAAEEEVEQPKKKARSTASVAASKPAKAAESTAAPAPPTRKKRSASKDEPSLATPAASEEAPAKASEAKKKGKRKAAQPEPSTSSAPTASPAAPSVASKRKTRANATDFFEDSASNGVAPPPNTPADGLKAVKPSSLKKKVVEQTPVSGAISKLAEVETLLVLTPTLGGPAPAPVGDKPMKNAKAKADAKGADQPAEADASAKKLAKKAKGDKAAEVAAPGAAYVSMQDVRRKITAASGLKKKEEKPLKVKRSAKETLIGKKGL